jgi:hypothetical protein
MSGLRGSVAAKKSLRTAIQFGDIELSLKNKNNDIEGKTKQKVISFLKNDLLLKLDLLLIMVSHL